MPFTKALRLVRPAYKTKLKYSCAFLIKKLVLFFFYLTINALSSYSQTKLNFRNDTLTVQAADLMVEQAKQGVSTYYSYLNNLGSPFNSLADKDIFVYSAKNIIDWDNARIFNDLYRDGDYDYSPESYLKNIFLFYPGDTGVKFDFTIKNISDIFYDSNKKAFFIKIIVVRKIHGIDSHDNLIDNTAELDFYFRILTTNHVFNHVNGKFFSITRHQDNLPEFEKASIIESFEGLVKTAVPFVITDTLRNPIIETSDSSKDHKHLSHNIFLRPSSSFYRRSRFATAGASYGAKTFLGTIGYGWRYLYAEVGAGNVKDYTSKNVISATNVIVPGGTYPNSVGKSVTKGNKGISLMGQLGYVIYFNRGTDQESFSPYRIKKYGYPLIISLGYGLRLTSPYQNIYQADENLYSDSNLASVDKGEYYTSPNQYRDVFHSFILGIKFSPLPYCFIKATYWQNIETGPCFMMGVDFFYYWRGSNY